MARPREFDENEVIDKALDVFWTKGFEATSIQDLVDATGLGRASLYGAFGDKQQLFQRVIERYRQRTEVEERRLEEAPSTREGLAQLFRAWLDLTCARTGPRGCFFLQVGAAGELRDKRALDAIEERSRIIERMIERSVRRGQARGELAADQNPAALARFFLVMLQGLSTAARAGWRRDRLESAVSEALDHLRAPR